jgi:hypothetical protein
MVARSSLAIETRSFPFLHFREYMMYVSRNYLVSVVYLSTAEHECHDTVVIGSA